MKLRSGKQVVAPTKEAVAQAKKAALSSGLLAEFDYSSIILYENGKRFNVRRTSGRAWHLNVYDDKTMMLILHTPHTAVDYFDEKPSKISYDDETLSVMIKRPVISYLFKFNDEAEYQSFKDLKLEEFYNE